MATPQDKDPDLPDLWLFWLWLAGSVFWFFLVHDYTPATHAAYWRETTVTAATVSMIFTVLAGFVRPAGWLAVITMGSLMAVMPTVEASSLCAYFWVSWYFTLVFSFGRTLTLRKMAKVSGISGLLIGFGYLIDPTARWWHLGLGILGWLSLIGLTMLVNGLIRLIRPPVQTSKRLDWEKAD